MIIGISQIAKKLKIGLPDLITRPVGRKMFSEIDGILQNAGSGEVVVFDFSGVRVIDSSFIDELIVRFIREACEGKRDLYFRLKNISPGAEINIESVLKNYSRFNAKKMVVITEEICKDNRFFIGPLDDVESNVVDYLRINRVANIVDLAEYSGLDITSMTGVMDELHSLRLVRMMEDNRYCAI